VILFTMNDFAFSGNMYHLDTKTTKATVVNIQKPLDISRYRVLCY